MGPRDSRNTVAGAVIPRFTTASATRSSSARSSVVNTSAVELVEKAWESSARTLSHFSATDTLENEVITVWKGSQNLLSCGIIWRGWGGVNKVKLAGRDRQDERDGRGFEVSGTSNPELRIAPFSPVSLVPRHSPWPRSPTADEFHSNREK